MNRRIKSDKSLLVMKACGHKVIPFGLLPLVLNWLCVAPAQAHAYSKGGPLCHAVVEHKSARRRNCF